MNDYLAYSKLILEKVSFDKRLFWKEYKKSARNLTELDCLKFRSWVCERFGFTGKTADRIGRINNQHSVAGSPAIYSKL